MTLPTAIRLTQRLRIPFDFPVVFTRSLFDPANPLLADTLDRLHEKRRHRFMVCLDSGVRRTCPDLPRRLTAYARAHRARLELAGDIVTVGGGERSKDSLGTATRLVQAMHARRLCRHSVVLIVGGGSVLDVAGFAASLVHRGLRVVRVPTTVAAQNDVGVGVKTGVDAFGAKNFLGTFAPPFAVLNDLDFLDNLPHREWIAGLSEAFKVALIKDKPFFAFLCRNAARLHDRDRVAMEQAVVRCAKLHLDHIRSGGDPFETGSARPLDFGHWSAHQLEVMSHYQLRHGEAVSIGIALDMVIAWRLGFVGKPDLDALLAGLRACGLPVWTPLLDARSRNETLAILDGLEAFREHLGGELTLSLPCPVGRRTEIHELKRSLVKAAIRYLEEIGVQGSGFRTRQPFSSSSSTSTAPIRGRRTRTMLNDRKGIDQQHNNLNPEP